MDQKLPLYLKIRNDLKSKIDSGKWEVGSLIPSEKELAKIYGVSRVTIRASLKKLVEDKYLNRKAGFGTTVAFNAPTLLNFTLIQSFTSEMNEMGRPIYTMGFEFNEIKADSRLAKIFNIDEGSPLYNLKRIRGYDSPIMFSDTYLLPIMEMPKDKSILMGSLYEYLSSQNIYFSNFEEIISAVNTSKEIKDKLLIFNDSPQLRRDRFAYDQNNILIEYTETYYNAERYQYRTKMYYRK